MGSPRRTYGLDADLRPLPGRPPAAPIPAFSVEIEASSFDHRGRPVLLGRAAEVKGTIRMPAGMSSAVVLKVSLTLPQPSSAPLLSHRSGKHDGHGHEGEKTNHARWPAIGRIWATATRHRG